MNKLVAIALLLAIFSVSPNLSAQGPAQNDDLDVALNETSAFIINNSFSEKDVIRELDPNGFKYNVRNLDINTKYSEHSTSFFNDRLIFVSSKKIGAMFVKKDKKTNEGYQDLYCAEIDFNGDAKKTASFSRILNTLDNHEGDAAFNNNQSVVYFSRSVMDGTEERLKIFRAELKEYKWVNIEMLPVNVEGFAFENPALSTDAKTLYFASNMPGTFGGYDIFSVSINDDGTYGKPKNLGKNINTIKDENFPYMLEGDTALYFSSNGHYAMGGLDIFESKITDGAFNFPVNMGSSINSVADDFAFMMDQNNTGFFTSNRDGGEGGNDIYHFTRRRVEQKLALTVVEKESQIFLPNAEIEVLDAYGRLVDKINVGEDAMATLDITPYNTYTLKVTKDGYEDLEAYFESDRGDQFTFETRLELSQAAPEIVEKDDKLMIVIENIYFDFDKWNIKEESTLSLNKIVSVMEENPEMNIEINAHTDARGSDRYNMVLSEKRAASALKYLKSKGIDSSRLISHGFGETQPIEKCGTKCSEDQHQTNRRVEFVILDM